MRKAIYRMNCFSPYSRPTIVCCWAFLASVSKVSDELRLLLRRSIC